MFVTALTLAQHYSMNEATNTTVNHTNMLKPVVATLTSITDTLKYPT